MRLFPLVALLSVTAVLAQPTIEQKTSGATGLAGYFPLYWDAKAGKLWLEIGRFDSDFLYVESLPAGLGSKDIGLDRGQFGATRIVRFERVGPTVLLVEPNPRYRALGGNADERRAVAESFPEAVLWGFQVEAESGSRVLVDATGFFLRDAHDIPGALRRANEKPFQLDATRCALYLPGTKNFPKNTEVEATLTFSGEEAGPFLASVTADPQAFSVREHHSFIELPDGNYRPRAFDPRCGFIPTAYVDAVAPLGEPLTKRFIIRHRLRKKDPKAALSEPVEPIVYFVDRGAPEPIRSALADGARWWNQAFEAAGYRNAFRVEVMPEGADPMDIRYNTIQWVHRSTRGWSYGDSVVDPRTGEIICGRVTLGSLRARQDYLIAEGLLAPYAEGRPIPPDLRQMVLARMRQLAAHEVGHTLGLAHNFAASVKDRASVMDYPHALIRLTPQGVPDLREAYATGIGAWDKTAIAYGYQDFATGADERQALDSILRKSTDAGYLFLSDADARPAGGAHPLAHLWDNGADPVDELNRIMQVRAAVLARFGERNIRKGAPMSSLEDVLVPMYLLHRYQVEAAAKMLGGAWYSYATRGDGQRVLEPVPGADQRRALAALLATIRPEALTLPESVLRLIPPPAYGYERTREDFAGRTGLTFDPVAAAEAAANLTVSLILNPERAARLLEYHAEDGNAPGLQEVVDRLLAASWKAAPPAGLAGEVHRAVDSVVLYHLMALAATDSAPMEARAIAFATLKRLQAELQPSAVGAEENDHRAFGAALIARFLANPKEIPLPKPADPPPGQPI